MNESSYTIKTHVFEGPLDTLLSLIEKRKLFINDISLSQVADDYITYIKNLADFPIADSAHFILIASTLILIKSKSLLPDLQLTEEEESSIEDLESRLVEYQKYKELSRHLRDRFGMNVSYVRQPSREKKIVFAPDKNTHVEKMHEVIRRVIAEIPKKEIVPHAVIKKVMSLEEMIESLTERITKSMKMSFKDFSGLGKEEMNKEKFQENKIEIIVSFLAMLELVKQGIIDVRQEVHFQDIEMETQRVGIPRY